MQYGQKSEKNAGTEEQCEKGAQLRMMKKVLCRVPSPCLPQRKERQGGEQRDDAARSHQRGGGRDTARH